MVDTYFLLFLSNKVTQYLISDVLIWHQKLFFVRLTCENIASFTYFINKKIMFFFMFSFIWVSVNFLIISSFNLCWFISKFMTPNLWLLLYELKSPASKYKKQISVHKSLSIGFQNKRNSTLELDWGYKDSTIG